MISYRNITEERSLPFSAGCRLIQKKRNHHCLFKWISISAIAFLVGSQLLIGNGTWKSISLFHVYPVSSRSLADERFVEGQPVHSSPPTTYDEDNLVAFDFPPSVKDVFINVGSNVDPFLPGTEFGPCSRTIAVEPIVSDLIPKHPQIHVLPVAVSDKPGNTTMRVYNDKGLSSSLAQPSEKMWWNEPAVFERNGELVQVPVVTLSSILYAVPESSSIRMIKTDMQGYDFTAIKAAGQAIIERGVTHIQTEVWFDDVHTYDVENDLCRDFLPFMTELGFAIHHVNYGKHFNSSEIESQCENQIKTRPQRPPMNESGGLSEGDAFWIRKDVMGQAFPKTYTNQYVPVFSKNEYEQCDNFPPPRKQSTISNS